MAGVFSKCQIPPTNEPDPTTPGDCCLDPVVYQRVDEEIKHWIRNTAPGVRDSLGCPKKIISMICRTHHISNSLQGSSCLNILIFHNYISAPPEPERATGCRCGVELPPPTLRDSGSNRIVGGPTIRVSYILLGGLQIK